MAELPVATRKTAPAPVPDHPLRQLRGEMDRLFDRFGAGFGMPSWRSLFDMEPAWRYESSFAFAAPAVDVTEDDEAYQITAEMPGADEKNIEISVSGDMLTLKGEKRQEKEEKDKNRYVCERAYGSFQRRFALPDHIDCEKIGAELKNGVLTITLPKKAEAQKPEQKVEVKAAA